MKTALYFASSVVAVSLLIGCSSGTDTAQEFKPAESEKDLKTVEDIHTVVADSNLNETSPALLATQSKTPHVVLMSFLDALQGDNVKVAEGLLTDKARYETKRAKMEVSPVQAAGYQIGETRYATSRQKVAHVESIWTDKDEEGVQSSFEITWVMHRQLNDSWRVAGMLTAPSEDEPQIFLNFERPTDMVAKVEAVQSSEIINDPNVCELLHLISTSSQFARNTDRMIERSQVLFFKISQFAAVLALGIVTGCSGSEPIYSSIAKASSVGGGKIEVAFLVEDVSKLDSKVLSAPRLIILKGREGRISVGDDNNCITCTALVEDEPGAPKAKTTVTVKKNGNVVWTKRQTLPMTP